MDGSQFTVTGFFLLFVFVCLFFVQFSCCFDAFALHKCGVVCLTQPFSVLIAAALLPLLL